MVQQSEPGASPRRGGDLRCGQAAKEETREITQRLRLLVFLSQTTQREIERRAGFSRGYLSQVFGGEVELKLKHLVAIHEAMRLTPHEFFSQLFHRNSSHAQQLIHRLSIKSSSSQSPLSLELARLYGFGMETLKDLQVRLARCERALQELQQAGFL